MYHVLSVAGYYLYSADIEFARAQIEIIKRQLAYNRSLVDPTLGLLITNAGGDGRDWDFYDGGKPGAVTAYNAIYYKALTDAAYLADELAKAYPADAAVATWQADSALWKSQAADIKQRLNATLFDAARGVYKLADRNNGNTSGNAVPQDANSEAIMWDIAPESARAGILSWLRSNLWGTFGPQPYSPEANYSTVISPFITGKEVDARFHAGDTKGAIDLIHLMWDQMVDENGPVLHRRGVGEAQPGRHRRRRQRQPRARLGQRPGLQPQPLRRGRAAGHRGLQDLDRRPAARRAGVGAGHAADPARRPRLALGPRRGQPLVQAHRRGARRHVRHGPLAAARPLAHGRDGRRRGVAGRALGRRVRRRRA